MLKVDKRIKRGTKVQVVGYEDWRVVKSVTDSHIKLMGWEGSWQYGHIIRFTNNNKLTMAKVFKNEDMNFLDKYAVDREQDWDEGTTLFIFEDCSGILYSEYGRKIFNNLSKYA